MKSCYGYVRVSTQKQGEGVSLEAQREAIERFASQNQITITEWFEEKQTAAKQGRPIFASMLKLLKAGKADGVVMHKIDRSARNFRDWAQIGDLADAGIAVHFATEALDFQSRGGRLSADIQAVIAADYIRNLREETIKGIEGRLKQGLYPFRAPMGYLDQGGGKPKIIDPISGPNVRRIFELYNSGNYSIRSLQLALPDLGIRNQHGKIVSKFGLENILQNPFYCGIIRIKRTGAIYKGIHEPLISVSLFEAVQARKAGKAVKRKTRHFFPYRSLLKCGYCRTSMIPERQKGHVYYRCHTKGCKTTGIRQENIEVEIRQVLESARLTDHDIKTLTLTVQKWNDRSDKKQEEKTFDMQLRKLADRQERLTDALIDRLIEKETFNERKSALLLEQERLREKAKKSAESKICPNHFRQFLERLKNLAEHYYFAEGTEKREIAEITTSNRFVNGKKLTIEPANWLQEVQMSLGVLLGPPDSTTSRTYQATIGDVLTCIQKAETPF
jgi:DNA invertase Pin-like site-specific DNA recombinase